MKHIFENVSGTTADETASPEHEGTDVTTFSNAVHVSVPSSALVMNRHSFT